MRDGHCTQAVAESKAAVAAAAVAVSRALPKCQPRAPVAPVAA